MELTQKKLLVMAACVYLYGTGYGGFQIHCLRRA